MKTFTFIKRTLAGLAIVPVLAFGFMARVQAAQIPFQEGVSPTSTTPIFNQFTGVPTTGDESDFVRLRTSNGDPTANAATNQFVDPVTATCNVGDKFDVRTYVHNGASQDFNNNGTGTAVAHDTTVSLTAPLNTTSNKFVFDSTISASNAASVTDHGTLNCGNNVRLEVSSHVFSSTVTGWVDRGTTGVNGSIKIGSHDATSGDVWACFDQRVMVVYTVKVVAAPTPPPIAVTTCDMLTLTPTAVKTGEKVTAKVNFTATNGATFKSAVVNFGDSSANVNSASNGTFSVDHTYTVANTYDVTAVLKFMVNGQEVTASDANCKAKITVTTTPPAVLPAATELPNTGSGAIAGIFALTTLAGATLHNVVARRRTQKI